MMHSPSVVGPGNRVLDGRVGRHLALESGHVTEDDLGVNGRLSDPCGN
jgi:hypothetical protein